jgi:hypothetical protein
MGEYKAEIGYWKRAGNVKHVIGARAGLATEMVLLAGFLRGNRKRALLVDAVGKHRDNLRSIDRRRYRMHYGVVANQLGIALSDLAGVSRGNTRRRLYREAIRAYGKSLKVFRRDRRGKAYRYAAGNFLLAVEKMDALRH